MKLALLFAFLAVLMAAGSLQAANPILIMETSMGIIKIELFEEQAPVTVKNFLSYVDDKHYDNTIFHRVKDGFMIQGGGFSPGMREKETKKAIKNEAGNGLSNLRGTLAMARLNDPDTATAQFFINVVDNKFLDRNTESAGYAVFGRVTEGMDIVDKIRKVKTGTQKGHSDVPNEDVIIKSVKRSTSS